MKISKNKAINYKTGATTELEELRIKYRDLLEEKVKTDKELADINRKRDEEEGKKIKNAESTARWDEKAKWRRQVEKLEARLKDLETELERTKRTNQNLRTTISRMEKEKIILETRLASSATNSTKGSRSSSASASTTDAHLLAQGEIAKLKMEIQDLQELNEKIEFEGREEAEKLKMEVKLLKERIVSQERQLTAYQIAQKVTILILISS